MASPKAESLGQARHHVNDGIAIVLIVNVRSQAAALCRTEAVECAIPIQALHHWTESESDPLRWNSRLPLWRQIV